MTTLDEAVLEFGDVKTKIIPAKGALVTALNVRGKDILYLDRASLEPDKSVRGGIPFLFPFAGKLEGGVLARTGTEVPQHGFARDKEWAVIEKAPGTLRLALESDAQTEQIYPWRFRAEYDVTLVPRGIHIGLWILNRAETTLPVAPGWHPYLPCSASKKEQGSGDFEGTEPGFLDNGSPNFHKRPPVESRAAFQIPDLGKVALSFSPKMRTLQFWSLPDRDFVCIEPFTGPANFINTPEAHEIPAGEARDYWMRLELVD